MPQKCYIREAARKRSFKPLSTINMIQKFAVLLMLFCSLQSIAQDEMQKYGQDPLFAPLFTYMLNKEVDSAFAFLDSISIEGHGLPHYKAAQLIKLDIKFDLGRWDMSIANDIQNLLPYWESDSLNLLNMYAIVCKKNGELKEARETFEFCYQKREEKANNQSYQRKGFDHFILLLSLSLSLLFSFLID